MNRRLIFMIHAAAALIFFIFSDRVFPKEPPLRVLLTTGDWKSQAWYQDIWMARDGKAQLYRGRFIQKKVNEAFPGEFEFTEIPNYLAQQYLDEEYLSGFDVVLIGDIMCHLPDKFQEGIRQFVNNGGGLVYCANHKWGTGVWIKGGVFESVLPSEWPDPDGKAEFNSWLLQKDFKILVKDPNHPLTAGLDWAGAPPLGGAVNMPARSGATVILAAPDMDVLVKEKDSEKQRTVKAQEAPILTSWQFGKGRVVFSASIFSNDEQSEKFGEEWQDFGKYYGRMFKWLGENSLRQRRRFKQTEAKVEIEMDCTKRLNEFSPAIFSIHGNEDIKDLALDNYMALNPQGGISRGYPDATEIEGALQDGKWVAGNDNDDSNVIDWNRVNVKRIDDYIAECARYGTQPMLCCHGNQYRRPQWMWGENRWFSEATEKDAEEIAEMVSIFLERANCGRRGNPAYKNTIRYVDLGNEPILDERSLPGWVRIVNAVGKRVHRDYPGVAVGSYSPHWISDIGRLFEDTRGNLDWLSFHPYGWTQDEFFKYIDDIQHCAREKGLNDLKIMITEWDFWIQGRPKFDYMMRRWFESVKRTDLIGALHYRLWQYNEPIYLFGILWVGWGPKDAQGKPIAGSKGTPMHDSYDAYWIWKDFRGQRIDVSKKLARKSDPESLLNHLHVAGSTNSEGSNLIAYYDWAYNGAGFRSSEIRKQYPKLKLRVKMKLSKECKRNRISLSRATGEGSEVVWEKQVPSSSKEIEEAFEIHPLEAFSLKVTYYE